MPHLASIEIVSFKGVSRLRCDFDDLTVLAGLNNSGKTTILQAVYLLLVSLPKIAVHPQLENAHKQNRIVSLDDAISPLGLRDWTWLASIDEPEIEGLIVGHFGNSLQVELGIARRAGSQCMFTLSQWKTIEPRREVRDLVVEASRLSAAILTPPGDVPSREAMVSGNEFRNQLRQGKGAQLWRNSIWWGIQDDGFETFAPVQEQISRHFPDIKLLLPTLSSDGQPEVLVKYKEKGGGPLDIAQSGAGLRTFVSLARILEQSAAKIVLLDEPDAHLHSSQQAVILELMVDASCRLKRQIIIATHSPEIITRVPQGCLRWVERNSEVARGGEEVGTMLERLGATPDVYVPPAGLPQVLVYVEGVKDRPIVEALIKWCRAKVASSLPDEAASSLPTTLVIPHKDGRFEAPTLQGIARVVKEFYGGARVVGIRDMDWYYNTLPPDGPIVDAGDGWALITLPCKEMENLFCDPDVLFHAYECRISKESIETILDTESQSQVLVEEWQYQVKPRVRDGLPRGHDPSTREREADEMFAAWSSNAAIRRRLVAGKSLLGQVRNRVRRDHALAFYPERVFDRLNRLSAALAVIARQIFPQASF